MQSNGDTRALGRTGIRVLPLGIGTNEWRGADRAAVGETCRTVMAAGPCMIDTAEVYVPNASSATACAPILARRSSPRNSLPCRAEPLRIA